MDQFQPGCNPLRPRHHAGVAPLRRSPAVPRSPSRPPDGTHHPAGTQQSPESTTPLPCGFPSQPHLEHHPGSFPAIARTQPPCRPQLLRRPPLTWASAWCGGAGGFRLPWLPRLSLALSLPVFSAEYVLSKTKPCIRLPASSQLIRLPVLLLLLNIARWLPALPRSPHLTNAM